jgi:type I restriction enzyme R subunit
VFRDLQKALSIYGSASGGGVQEGDTPVKNKSALVGQLRKAITEALVFCQDKGIGFKQLENTQDAFLRTKFWDEAVEAILVNDDSKRNYFSIVNNVTKLYKAILPDIAASEFTNTQALLTRLADKIRLEVPDIDISKVAEQVEELLDDSITAGKFIISNNPSQLINLNDLDFEALKAQFNTGYQRTVAEKLKGNINSKVQNMVQLNKTRINYLDKFQKMIDDYNAGSSNVEWFFNELINFAQELKTEDKRAICNNLTEEELAIFDLLTQPEIKLSKEEELEVKQVARELLSTLKREKLVLDWRKRQQTRAGVEVAIKDILDKLPQSYSIETYEKKCLEVYQHIYENYSEREINIYQILNEI